MMTNSYAELEAAVAGWQPAPGERGCVSAGVGGEPFSPSRVDQGNPTRRSPAMPIRTSQFAPALVIAAALLAACGQ